MSPGFFDTSSWLTRCKAGSEMMSSGWFGVAWDCGGCVADAERASVGLESVLSDVFGTGAAAGVGEGTVATWEAPLIRRAGFGSGRLGQR